MNIKNINDIQQRLYRACFSNADVTKANKIIKVLSSDTVTPLNYWDMIRRYTKNVTSDSSVGRWQCLAELGYDAAWNEYQC